VELCDTARLSSLRGLRHLGPDILDPSFDLEQVLARLRLRGDKEIAVALLDQSALAGIGNVYKNEVLFLCGVSPFTRTGSIDSATLKRIVETAVRLMRRNLTTGIRTTTSSGSPRPLWVYGAHGRPCPRCGSTIQRQTQGIQARMTYWCPTCQPVSPGTEGVSPVPVEQHEEAAAGNLTS
jgi:endonuclease-8